MLTIHNLLILIAFLFFVLAGFGVGASKVQFAWLAFACLVLVVFVVT